MADEGADEDWKEGATHVEQLNDGLRWARSTIERPPPPENGTMELCIFMYSIQDVTRRIDQLLLLPLLEGKAALASASRQQRTKANTTGPWFDISLPPSNLERPQ